ncbi:MAG: tetratricopeptide repeat protein [Alphaproteobacteria bacterium]|nr:tetratricopeptide repeat protein [Alphaproteobacteria bacterium]
MMSRNLIIQRCRPWIAALAIGLATPCAALAEWRPSGAYLTAREAERRNDFSAAAHGYLEAMRGDASNPFLIDGALAALVGAGKFERAVAVARLVSRSPGKSRTVDIVLVADHLRNARHEAATGLLGSRTLIGTGPDGLLKGWALFGAGQRVEAAAMFESVARIEGFAAPARFSAALAAAAAGDLAAADSALSSFEADFGASRRSILARVQVLSGLGRTATARALLDDVVSPSADAEIAALRARLDAGEMIPFDIARTAADGAAEAFLMLAADAQGDNRRALDFARIGQFLRPDHADATLLAAQMLLALGQSDLAIATFEAIPAGSPARFAARLGRVEVLSRGGRTKRALVELASLARAEPGNLAVHVATGDLLRRELRFAEAAVAYGRAIELIATPEPGHWPLFYSRAIAHERAMAWADAEPDFRKALELSPDQPQVLSDLGQLFLKMGVNLDEALALIESAAAQRPEDGHIVQSLALGLFVLGRYDEAVAPMEQAADLLPADPIVTDHLGDVYWAVGNRCEARIQWRRALSFAPEPHEVDRIRRKLDLGLDAVLAEEGAPPLRTGDAALRKSSGRTVSLR